VSIDVANESAVQADEARLSSLARYVLDELRIHPLAELSVILIDEEPMAELHQRWMDESGPTDVLSFPMDELRPGSADPDADPGILGDVIICPQVAQRQADKAGHSAQDEIDLLCTHGILHLLGYDHAEPEEHREMFALQDRLLSGFRGGRDTSDEEDDTSR
jgi:probable rRNA maturation factor